MEKEEVKLKVKKEKMIGERMIIQKEKCMKHERPEKKREQKNERSVVGKRKRKIKGDELGNNYMERSKRSIAGGSTKREKNICRIKKERWLCIFKQNPTPITVNQTTLQETTDYMHI